MARPLLSKKKAHSYSFALFLVGIGVLFYTQQWWPGIMLVVGIPLALRQYLLGRKRDSFVSIFVFLGVFIAAQFSIPWETLLPVIFVLGGIYIFCREFFESSPEPEVEQEEDLAKEIEEEHK